MSFFHKAVRQLNRPFKPDLDLRKAGKNEKNYD